MLRRSITFMRSVGHLRLWATLLLFLLLNVQLRGQDLPADAKQFDNAGMQLEQYLHQAAQQNPEIEAAFNQYLAALEEVPQIGSLPDPELAFGYFVSPIETRVGPQQARLSISQMFPWFGTLGAREDIKTHQAQAQFQEFQTKRNQLFYEVKATWYELYVIGEKIKIHDENISLLETLEEIALQKYETAEGNQSDVLQVQIELEDLRIARSKLLDDREVLRQEFSELMNSDTVDFPSEIDLSATDLPAEPVKLKQQMMAENPSLKKLISEEQAATESIRAARFDGLPKFTIGATYILTGQREVVMANNGRDAFMARATIQIPLWRDKYRAQKKQAALEKRAVQKQKISQENKFITQFEKTMRDFRDASRKLELYKEKQIARTHQAINVLTEQYSAAATDFEEILRLHRRLLNYRQLREEAIGNKNKAVARIEFFTGKYNLNSKEINN